METNWGDNCVKYDINKLDMTPHHFFFEFCIFFAYSS